LKDPNVIVLVVCRLAF